MNDSPAGDSSLVIDFLAVTSSLTYPPFYDRFVFALEPFGYVRLTEVRGLWFGWALAVRCGPNHWTRLTP